jgi:hypothetical protein
MRLFICTGALLVLVGCSAPPPEKPWPEIEPHSTGATLYMVEANQDWLDDGGPDILNPGQQSHDVFWVGEQALRIMLRVIARGKNARLLAGKRFEPRGGVLSEIFLPEAVDYMAALPDGKFELRRHRESAGFKLSMTPLVSADGNYAAVVYSLRRRCAIRAKLPGTGFSAGEPEFEDAWLESGQATLPLGGSLLFCATKGSPRVLLVLLHVATVAS